MLSSRCYRASKSCAQPTFLTQNGSSITLKPMHINISKKNPSLEEDQKRHHHVPAYSAAYK